MCEAWERYYEAARQDGRKSATIEGIIFMIKYGISKNDLLKKYSEEDYNEALSKIESK